MGAIGYIRQSRRADLDVALSYDVQLAAIRRMAAADGLDPDDVTILSDMGRSGAGGKERLRPAYQELLAAIDRGAVTHVYALTMSRVARSLTELSRFYDLCVKHGIRVRFDKEGEIRFDTPDGKLRANIIGSVYEFERDLAVERAKDNAKERRRRGERMGRAPYGDKPGESIEAVIAAYRKAGSYNGAAVELNNQQIATRLGRPWTGTSVRVVVARHAPGEAPRAPKRGAKATSPFMLYRMLRCPYDRRMLTGSRDGRGDRDVVYRCHGAEGDPAHPRPYRIRERAVLEWLPAEYETYAERVMPKAIERAGDEDRRAALEDQRRAVGDALTVRAYTVQEAAAKIATIEAELEALDDAASILEVPAMDWTWPAGDIRKVLIALAEAIDLDDAFRPARVAWRIAA